MRKLASRISGIIGIILFSYHVQAQEIRDTTLYTTGVVLKTNLLYDATTTLNLGVEFRLSRKFTFDLPFNYNPWTFGDDKKIKHRLIQPELRYWVNESFHGSFWGLHLHGAQFNTAKVIDSYRYQGWLAGAGVSYGYRWALSDRWAMEATIGAGYAYLDYDKWTAEGSDPEGCETCGRKITTGDKNYWGITKAGLSLTYTIGKTPKKQIVTEMIEVIRPVIRTDTVFVTSPTEQYRCETGKACILFPLDQSVLLPDLERNPEELAQIDRSIRSVHSHAGAKIKRILIEAYASPEGELQHNITLSEQRMAALRDYMVATYGLDAGSFTVRSKGENWQGLRSAVGESRLLTDNEKKDVVRILDIQDLATRKALLKKYKEGKVYAYLLRDVYPTLRVSEYRIDYTVPLTTVNK
jgi:outer membrane protein OmpA-like peptidoglycan-associated protein